MQRDISGIDDDVTTEVAVEESEEPPTLDTSDVPDDPESTIPHMMMPGIPGPSSAVQVCSLTDEAK